MDDPNPSTAETLTDPDLSQATPQRIGHFRILQRIGEGGMGIVYLAEQEEPIRRRVAVKLIRWGEVARFLQNLDEILRETGDFAAARPIYMRALAIREKTLGVNHRDTAWSLHGIAHLDADEDRYAEAKRNYSKALEIEKQVLGPDHPNIGWTLCGLADLYSKQGRQADAEGLYVQALANLEKNFGPDSPDVKKTREILAKTREELAKQAGPISR